MAKERTFETGGEILRTGSSVIVSQHGKRLEGVVESIGTANIHISVPGGSMSFSLVDRRGKGRQVGVGSSFRTKTEQAAIDRLAEARLRLLALGMRDDRRVYPAEALEEVAAVLEKYRNIAS